MTDPQRHVSCRLYCLRELDAMRPQDWADVRVTPMPVGNLTPTQCCLKIDRLVDLAAGGAREGHDPIGHAVDYRGRVYIHDGHHDWALRWLAGHAVVPVRVKTITQACSDPCCQENR